MDPGERKGLGERGDWCVRDDRCERVAPLSPSSETDGRERDLRERRGKGNSSRYQILDICDYCDVTRLLMCLVLGPVLSGGPEETGKVKVGVAKMVSQGVYTLVPSL